MPPSSKDLLNRLLDKRKEDFNDFLRIIGDALAGIQQRQLLLEVLRAHGPEISAEMLEVVKKRLKEILIPIERETIVQRGLSLQDVIDVTHRTQYHQKDGKKVVAPVDTGPNEKEAVTVVFTRFYVHTRFSEIMDRFAKDGLRPDPLAVSQVNADDPTFADQFPNLSIWRNGDEDETQAVIYGCIAGQRTVSTDVTKYSGIDGGYWVGGTRIKSVRHYIL